MRHYAFLLLTLVCLATPLSAAPLLDASSWLQPPSTVRIVQPTSLPGGVEAMGDLCALLRPTPAPTNPPLPFPETLRIFVHGAMRDDASDRDPPGSPNSSGYNEGQQDFWNESLRHIAGITESSRLPSGLLGFAWDSSPGFFSVGHPTEDAINAAAHQLALLLAAVKDCDPRFNGPIELVGHSYGAVVVLRALARVREYCPPPAGSTTVHPPGLERVRVILLNGAFDLDDVQGAKAVIVSGKTPIKSFYLPRDSVLRNFFLRHWKIYGIQPVPDSFIRAFGLSRETRELRCHWDNCNLEPLFKQNGIDDLTSHGASISAGFIGRKISEWGRFKYTY